MFGISASLWKRGHLEDVFRGFESNLNVITQYLSFEKSSAENFTNCQKKKTFTADSSDLSCRLLFIYFHLYSYLIEIGFFLSHIYILLHN